MTLEDIAAQTRIPQRHLESLEVGNWDRASGPDLHHRFRPQLRDRGRARPHRNLRPAADRNGRQPSADRRRRSVRARRPGADHAQVAGVRSGRRGRPARAGDDAGSTSARSTQPADVNAAAAEAPAADAPGCAPGAAPRLRRQVTVTATEPVWLQINEKGGAILYSAMMVPGQSFTVPPTATAPVLKTGKPEALRITVGNSVAPPVGPPATTVSNVSLLPADLMRGGQAATVAPAATAAPAPARAAALAAGRDSPSAAANRSGAPAPRRRRRRPTPPASPRIHASESRGGAQSRTIAKRGEIPGEVIPYRRPARRLREPRPDSGLRAGPAPAADARAAPRPPRAPGPADAAPGLPQGPPGGHRGLLGRARGDPVVGRDARPAARFARAADERPAPPVGGERPPPAEPGSRRSPRLAPTRSKGSARSSNG